MSTPAPPPVQAVPAFSFPETDVSFRFDPIVLFTVPLATPARIDAVFMQAVAASTTAFQGEVWGLQLAAPGGAIQAQVWTPPLNFMEISGVVPQCLLTWMVDGVGTDQLATATFIDASQPTPETVTITWTGALPDLVLQPNATVSVLRATPAGADEVDVSSCTVTYTPNAGAVSSSDVIDILPLLVPTSTG